jgi:hypothetical protein
MSPRLRTLLLAAGLLVAAGAVWLHLASPERRVLRRLDELAERLGKNGAESQLAAAATARGVADFFAPGFVVRAQPYDGSLSDPRELMAAVMRLRGAGERNAVDFAEGDVQLDEASRSAVVTFVATVTLDRGRGPSRETWRVRSLWIEDAEEWRISELELLERVEDGGLFGGF